MGENTPFTRKCTSEHLKTLEKVTTTVDFGFRMCSTHFLVKIYNNRCCSCGTQTKENLFQSPKLSEVHNKPLSHTEKVTLGTFKT